MSKTQGEHHEKPKSVNREPDHLKQDHDRLTHELDESFPASDPPSSTNPGSKPGEPDQEPTRSPHH